MTKHLIDDNMHTLHGRIPKVGIDSKNNGGVHIWVRGCNMPMLGEDCVSVHLNKEQTILLAKELIYRVYKHTLNELEQLMKIGDK